MMKKLILALSIGCFSLHLTAQQITSFTTLPANPTTNDPVKIKVDAWFPSGSCELFQSSINKSGNTFDITFLHCLGMLTVICNQSDTFDIGNLNAGTYQVNLNMQTGALTGPTPCTPSGLTTSAFSFTVAQAVAINEQDANHIHAYISNGRLIIKLTQPLTDPCTIKLLNYQGQIILETLLKESDAMLLPESVSKGNYLLCIYSHNRPMQTLKVFVD